LFTNIIITIMIIIINVYGSVIIIIIINVYGSVIIAELLQDFTQFI